VAVEITLTSTQIAQAIEETLPEHEISLGLIHNPHHGEFQSVEDFTADSDPDEWVSPDQRMKAISKDDLWQLKWYADTPTIFQQLFAADLSALLERIERK
jgi:hypothetical protein